MKYVYFKINLTDLPKIYFATIKKKKILYLFKSNLVNYIFENLKLTPKNCKQIKWNFNNIKKDSMLLGYKVEIDYLNKFIDDFTKYLNLNETKEINIYLKKDLSYFRVFNDTTLLNFLYCVLTLKYHYKISTIFIPKIKHYEFYEQYFKKTYDVRLKTYFDLFEYIRSHLKNIKLSIKKLLKIFSINKKNLTFQNYGREQISIEVALSVFKPQDIFTFTPSSNIIFINKIHKLSSLDNQNLKLSKKYFYPMYDFNEKNISLSNEEIQLFKQKFKIKKNNYYSDNFFKEFLIWLSYFKKTNTKFYLTNYKYSSHIIPASLAIHENNGISSMFQTSFYEKTSPYSLIFSDIYFSFSNKFNNAEKIIGSSYKYNVSVGYTYDYKFENAKKNSIKKREYLHNNGARKIISFFDQGAIENNQFTSGFMHIRESYEFLLNKLLSNDWLGLIIKPKKPKLLKKSLGPIYDLLLKAQQTKRCFVYLDSDEVLVKNFENPPCEAAYASDISIHNCLVAGTAGIESALTGRYTIFFDYFGFEESIFYEYKNSLVFNDWEKLWEHLLKKIDNNSSSINNEWEFILDNIDPFKDGKSFERIEEFSNNILKGYNQFEDKGLILQNAINLYRSKWGEDKIITN